MSEQLLINVEFTTKELAMLQGILKSYCEGFGVITRKGLNEQLENGLDVIGEKLFMDLTKIENATDLYS